MWNALHQATALEPNIQPTLKDKPSVRFIPYDYVATFKLNGEPGRLIEDVINISVEGTFIAFAIGYGLAADTINPVELIPKPLRATGNNTSNGQLQLEDLRQRTLADMTLANIPPHVLMDGFRFNPALERLAFPNGYLDLTLNVDFVNKRGLFQWLRSPKNFNFLYNVIDTGAGRELQNAPIHSIAGLGKPNGERPFRLLAQPLSFLPRSSVRVQVEEKSIDVQGELYVVLQGYKILGAAGVAEEHLRTLHQRSVQTFGPKAAAQRVIHRVEQGHLSPRRLLPFDYVRAIRLQGQKDRVVEEEININVEGGFVATALSYSLAVDDLGVTINFDQDEAFRNLAEIRLSQIPTTVLKDGFRIRPEFLRIAFENGKLTTLPNATVARLFEILNSPENVSFLYSITDTGTGRDWQSEPVLSTAGLGIADGERPFRWLAWPMHFLPRSTIRLRVQENFGRGQLFIVFQGYKILGAR